MAHTHLKTLMISCLTFCLASSVFAYSGGSGTQADPYQIGTVADWNDLMTTDTDANFVLISDLDLKGVSLNPVGDARYNKYFKGIFDGQGHIIRNAAITSNWPGEIYIGLFGGVGPTAQIRNLGVEDVNMVGGGRVGGLAAYSYGTIINCYTTGKVAACLAADSSGFGGLVGKNYGTITGSHSACDVNGAPATGLGLVGGLAGSNVGTIIDCYAAGPVTGHNSVGGLVGENTSTDLKPVLTGNIEQCYAAGSVNGYSAVGGLVGRTDIRPVSADYSITDCYAIGAVTGHNAAGLVGFSQFPGRFHNCYAAGPVIAADANFGYGFCGVRSNYPVYSDANCFWDIETSGQPADPMAKGKTTAEMKTLSTFTSEGWDFNSVWTINEGIDYPRLSWEPLPPECNLKITPQTINRRSNQPYVGASIQLPDGMSQADIDTSEFLCIYPGGIKAAKQSISNNGISAEFDKAALMAAVPNGDIELKVAGKLKSGHYFYGAGKIKIMDQKSK